MGVGRELGVAVQISAVDFVLFAAAADRILPDRLQVGGFGGVNGNRLGEGLAEELEGGERKRSRTARPQAGAVDSGGAGPGYPEIAGGIARQRRVLFDRSRARRQRLWVGPLHPVEAHDVV